ncbi:MAG: exodeoxyribonuclease VII large subunit [Cyanobacteria bacterium]|nr:exodeoxyribonuclease VII large subunit [Cyanobacteriota bacterium]MDW8200070.1 exodeoxyribonuclease VII large subunit [Cyanobacteriota bacterium SKYGB_h_bin112]
MNLVLPSLLVPDRALSVAELTTRIQNVLEEDEQFQQVWVTGEVSSASRYRSGLFFTLQDLAEKATISCVVWSSQLNKLVTLPSQGEQIVILGRLHLHAQRGQYQLVVWQVLPAGEGLRSLQYRQLRDRLEAEGLFDPQRKRPLPPHPQVIAVVTSPQAAAWGDIQRTLKHRYPGLRIQFSPALVQGDQAPEAIVNAIRRVEQAGKADVLILSRGGGATEDMACFNDERVVRAVANCSIPVISGIGHQRDESLADLAADVCAHTPTAAAEQAVPALADLDDDHQARVQRLYDAVIYYWQMAHDRLQRSRDRLKPRLLELYLQREHQTHQRLKHQLIHSAQQQVQRQLQHCHLLRQKLITLDPYAVLQRGYALVQYLDGHIARAADELQVGQHLNVRLAQGQVQVQVTAILAPNSLDEAFPVETRSCSLVTKPLTTDD